MPDGTVKSAEQSRYPVNNYEHEVYLNERKRQIVLPTATLVDLIVDEFEETVYESKNKISSIGPKESKIFLTDPINIEKGIQHEWFIKIEEIEDEEELTDNLLSVYAFIPPES